MKPNRSSAAVFGLALLLITPAAAQSPPAGQSNDAATAALTVPAGSLQKVQNAWRARALVGTPVFDDNGQRIATIRDLLITDGGAVDRVVLSVSQRNRHVAIPFGELRFVPSQSFGTPVGRRGRVARIASDVRRDIRPYGVMLPGASRDSLASMAAFRS